jgi:SNF2 family DNA or RNA helicase
MSHTLDMYHANKKRYRFISSNAGNMIDKLETTQDTLTGVDVKSLKMDSKMIIVDEAHNILVAASNGSKNASALYDMLMKAKNCRILLMTASPIVNTVYEAAIALNLCKGPIRTEDGEFTTLLPESAEDFAQLFINEKALLMKNTDKLCNRILGLISYVGDLYERSVPDFYKMLQTTVKKENYPDYSIAVKLINMSNIQYSAYEQAREKERLETRRAITGKGERIVLHPNSIQGGSYNGYTVSDQERRDAHYISGGELKRESAFKTQTSYRIKSRQLSNVYFPDDKDKLDIYADIATYAPKIKAIGDKLKPGIKTIIYSNFLKSGLTIMAGYLEQLGYKRYIPDESMDSAIHGYFGLYTGDVSIDDRTATLKEYNKPNSPLTILLISSSGSEGLSTIGTRVVHIMEPYWNFERIYQVMFRAIRYRSHEKLPEKERNVKVFIYLAVPPVDIKATEKTTDMYLFTELAKKYQINQQMVRLMASVAIDCDEFNKKANFDCYKCETRDGAPLYLADIKQDMMNPSPCKRTAKPIVAKEISLSGQLYYVSDDHRVFIMNKFDEYEEILDHDIKEWILSKLK